MKAKALQKNVKPINPFVKQQERLSIWQKAKGMWSNRQLDPIQELNRMRQEWD